jgi:hypothetical protein
MLPTTMMVNPIKIQPITTLVSSIWRSYAAPTRKRRLGREWIVHASVNLREGEPVLTNDGFDVLFRHGP